MLKTVTSKLSMPANRLVINVSSNRPNMVYATRRLVGASSNYNNLDFIIPTPYHPPMLLQKGVIFFDNKAEASDASAHLNSRLPEVLRDAGVIKHYHMEGCQNNTFKKPMTTSATQMVYAAFFVQLLLHQQLVFFAFKGCLSLNSHGRESTSVPFIL